MGPMTPPVDSRAPVCARLDRVRLRVYRGPEGICSINRARAICVRACAQVRERVRVRACMRVCVRFISARMPVYPRGGRMHRGY